MTQHNEFTQPTPTQLAEAHARQRASLAKRDHARAVERSRIVAKAKAKDEAARQGAIADKHATMYGGTY